LGEWYLQPGTRYDMIRAWAPWVKDSMHKVGKIQPGDIKGINHIVIHDGKEYHDYADPFHIMAKKIWSDMQSYETDVGIKFQPSSRIV